MALVTKLATALASFCIAGSAAWVCVPGFGEAVGERVSGMVDDLLAPPPDPTEEWLNGVRVCARCGGQLNVYLKHSGVRRSKYVVTEEQRWCEARIGACTNHLWQNTGCWQGRHSISCYMVPPQHCVWAALMQLDAQHADLFAGRFATLSPERQIELWRVGDPPSSQGGFEARSTAREVCEAAGWFDLAGYWSD